VLTFSDNIATQKTGYTYHFTVPNTATKIDVSLSMPSGADYDLSLWDANDARTGGYTPSGITTQVNNIPGATYSGWTTTPETISVDPVGSFGTWDLSVYSYSGTGTFTATVTITGGGVPDTTNPTVSISSPASGATITSSSVTVQWSGSDNVGIDHYVLKLDGTTKYTGASTSYTITGVSNGAHSVTVTAYDYAGNYATTPSRSFTVDAQAGTTEYWALIVGISDYAYINDLSYCDEDATDWYNQLISLGWQSDHIIVLGDSHSGNYPKWDGTATEYNMKQKFAWLATQMDSDDVFCYATSGHGSGDGNGNSYICAYDCGQGGNGEDGDFYDYEVAACLGAIPAAKINVFIDHCYSGGIGPEVMALSNANHIYMTTTCTEDGYGYDDSQHSNGAWTYYFLAYAWQSHFGGGANVAFEDIFDYAAAAYPHSGGDMCQEFDGYSGNFYLN